jgi:hypothetical protein
VARTPINSGDGQSGTAGTTLASPLRVLVTLNGAAQSGVTVAWAALDAGKPARERPTPAASPPALDARQQRGDAARDGVRARCLRLPVTFPPPSPPRRPATPSGGEQSVQSDDLGASGTTVLWLWPANSRRHNILPVSPATAPNSPTVVDGPYSYSFTFTTPGTYSYFCNIHGDANGTGMFATLVVQ